MAEFFTPITSQSRVIPRAASMPDIEESDGYQPPRRMPAPVEPPKPLTAEQACIDIRKLLEMHKEKSKSGYPHVPIDTVLNILKRVP